MATPPAADTAPVVKSALENADVSLFKPLPEDRSFARPSGWNPGAPGAPLSLVCPPGSLFAQTPTPVSGGWTFANTDEASGYRVFENYTVTGQICDIHWWGGNAWYSAGWFPCDKGPGEAFNIAFWNDLGGVPDIAAGPVCEYLNVVPDTRLDTGQNYAGILQMYYYEVLLLNPCCDLFSGWVSIEGVTFPSCYFLWASSGETGAGASYQEGAVPPATNYDLAVCLTGEYTPIFGACCDDSTGICVDYVEIIDCPAPLRFAADTLCIDLVPPCGTILGACCDLITGECIADMTEMDCAAIPDTQWFEGESCDAGFICPAVNDDCEDALPIGEVVDLPFDTSTATNDFSPCGITSPNIWYCYTPSCSGRATVSLCGSMYDTYLGVYDGCTCSPIGATLCCNDDYCGLQSQCDDIAVIEGNEYLIEVGGYSSNSGTGILNIWIECAGMGACCDMFTNECIGDMTEPECAAIPDTSWHPWETCANFICPYMGACCDDITGACIGDMLEAECAAIPDTHWYVYETCATFICPQPPPPNDNCADATPIGDVVDLPFSTIDATNDSPPGHCTGMNNCPNIWYCYTATCTGEATFSLCGSMYDTYLGVYDGCTCDPVGAQLCCNDDFCGLQSECPNIPVIVGNEYLVEVGGFSSNSGTGILNIWCNAFAGGCCLPDGTCENDWYQADCEAAGGIFLGRGVNCSGLDCNNNGVDDACDIAAGTSEDCQPNGIPDECDIASGTSQDCQPNGVPDECDIRAGTSEDCNGNGIPDECDMRDCPPNTPWCDDCQPNGILDECDLIGINVLHVSFRGLNIPGNRVALCDLTGTVVGEYNQIAGASSDGWGYRDGMSDGTYVYFGWAGGLAQHDWDGANGNLYCSGPPPGVDTWRALGYSPVNDSFWTCSFSTALVEVSRNCTLMTTWPNLDGWSMYGLAWDNNTNMLWSHDANCMVREVDPATGRWTGVSCSAQFQAAGIQGGLSMDDAGTLYSIIQGTPDALASFDTACNLTPPVTPNPRDIEVQVNENGVLGVAVIAQEAFSRDENGNGIPDECEGVIALGDMNCDGLIDAFDIDPFVLALTDPDAYNAMYPDCNIMNGDTDCDGDLDAFDIDPFVVCLTTGVCVCP